MLCSPRGRAPLFCLEGERSFRGIWFNQHEWVDIYCREKGWSGLGKRVADKRHSVNGGSVPWKDRRIQDQEMVGLVRSEFRKQMWRVSQTWCLKCSSHLWERWSQTGLWALFTFFEMVKVNRTFNISTEFVLVCFGRQDNVFVFPCLHFWGTCWVSYMYEVKWSEVAQPCPTLCNPMDCSLPRLLSTWNFPGKSTGMGCHLGS